MPPVCMLGVAAPVLAQSEGFVSAISFCEPANPYTQHGRRDRERSACLCGRQHNSNYFLNSAPSVPVVSIDTVDEAFPGIRNQECAAALAGKSELQLLLAGMYTKLEGVCVHYLEHWILS